MSKTEPAQPRLVVITGASRGVGAEVAKRFARLGHRLVLIARSEHDLSEIGQECLAAGARAVRLVPLDLRDLEQTEQTSRDLLAELGTPDVVISNAGHSIHRGVLEQSTRLHDHTRTMNVNHLGHVALLGPWLPAMAARGSGRIVHTSSSVARVPIPGWSAYVASKGAHGLWLRSVGPELERHGVSSCLVELGLVATAMSEPTHGKNPRFAISAEQAGDRVFRAARSKSSFVSPWWARLGAALTAVAPTASTRLVALVTVRGQRADDQHVA